MNEDQQRHLTQRLQAAAKDQPRILALRKLLLKSGGTEVVPPPRANNLIWLLRYFGRPLTAKVSERPMEEGQCHANVARLWQRGALNGVGMGYALSSDGLWREHSWGFENDRIVETTEPRLKYFGIRLRGVFAEYFALAMLE